MRALGYYNSKLEITGLTSSDCWSLEVSVQPGVRVTVNSIDLSVSGGLEETPRFQKLLKNLPIKIGEPLNHANYENLKLQVQALASQYGYFTGQYTTHELRIDPEANSASIRLVFESGERRKVGRVDIDQTQFRGSFIEKLVTIEQGDQFDSNVLTQQQKALNDSGYFSQVDIEVTRQALEDEKDIPIKISLVPRKKHAYRIGLGASTNEGPRVSLKIENRWLNRRGHSYNLDSSWSPIVKEVGLNYSIPKGESGEHRLDLGIGYREEENDTSDSDSLKLGGKLTQLRSNGWKAITSLELLRENFTTADTKDTIQLLTPGFGYSKTVRDNPLLPRKGWRLSSNVRVGIEGILSDLDLAQLIGTAKVVRPLHKSGRILARAGAGLSHVSDFSRLPASLRFFAGGDNSVRGFGYKSLGPTNSDGEVTGGKNLLTGSLEYEYLIKKPWAVAIFTDAGNAFNDFNDYEIKNSIGIGVRYHSIIGTIRVDLAKEINSSTSDIRLHISMGPDL